MVKQQRLEHISPLSGQLIALQKGIGQEEADIADLRGMVQHVSNHIRHIILLHCDQKWSRLIEIVKIVSNEVTVVRRDKVEQRLIDSMQIFAG